MKHRKLLKRIEVRVIVLSLPPITLSFRSHFRLLLSYWWSSCVGHPSQMESNRCRVWEFFNLLSILSSSRIWVSDEDSLMWWLDPSGSFSLKSFYVWNYQSDSCTVVNLAIQSSKALPWAISFLWTTGLGRIIIQDISRKKWRMIASACPLCLQAFEDVDHLLIHCPFSSVVWSFVLDRFGF